MYGSNDVPPAPTAHRHPASDPRESMRNELTQCQCCWKRKGPGVVLRKCTGCMIELYCSKECQKKAWPSHKEKCKLNKNAIQEPAVKALRAFTSKHRPTIAKYGCRALDLCVDPSRCMRDVVVVHLSRRPDSTRPETSFYARNAEVVRLEDAGRFYNNTEEMRDQLQKANLEHKRNGMLGAFFAILLCIDSGPPTMNIATVGFAKIAVDELRPGMPWKEVILRMMNEGIVT